VPGAGHGDRAATDALQEPALTFVTQQLGALVPASTGQQPVAGAPAPAPATPVPTGGPATPGPGHPSENPATLPHRMTGTPIAEASPARAGAGNPPAVTSSGS
jgi:hypothetical protein